MNLDDLRNLIEAEGGKILVVEDGKPILVVSSFEEYKKRANTMPALFASQSQQSVKELPKELEEEPLKIEDLPV